MDKLHYNFRKVEDRTCLTCTNARELEQRQVGSCMYKIPYYCDYVKDEVNGATICDMFDSNKTAIN